MEDIVFVSFGVLAVAAFVLNLLAKGTDQQRQAVMNTSFIKFQRSFFCVYFLALLGDWLQGPYVYKLYHYYHYEETEIAVLYVTGFASSVIFGTASGPLADKIGRRKMAQIFCLLYTFCCLTKLSANYSVLMLGRVLGGISTSMLFSTFEAWYVYEHVDHHDFPTDWIGVTFSKTTFWNGLLAIFAGIMANLFAETLGYGPVAPFVLAIAPLIICGLLVTQFWPENYGNQKVKCLVSCGEGLRHIISDKQVLLLGLIQTVVESVMYIFVFLWTPMLMEPESMSPPLGLVFASFMVSIMIGSSAYTLLQARGFNPESILRLILILLSFTMAVCLMFGGPERQIYHWVILYGTFLILETAIGMYFPAMSYLKSQIIPESHRANLMNWFRVPMNVITCLALLSLNLDIFGKDHRVLFAFCFGLTAVGIYIANRFLKSIKDENLSLGSTDEKYDVLIIKEGGLQEG